MSGIKSILLVEDDTLILEVLSEVLQDAGFSVVAAESGRAAYRQLGRDADPFCAIVTDVNLGDGPDGWAVARRGRELKRDLPVVYVSGASAHQWRAHGVPDSVLLAKPYNASQILAAITGLLTTTGLKDSFMRRDEAFSCSAGKAVR
jgi:DNA-binding response OmpR family regulator